MHSNDTEKQAISMLSELDSKTLAEKLFESEAEKRKLELLLDKANDAAIELRYEIDAASAVLGMAVGIHGDLLDRCNSARNKIKGREIPF